jgi:hypothetical protein
VPGDPPTTSESLPAGAPRTHTSTPAGPPIAPAGLAQAAPAAGAGAGEEPGRAAAEQAASTEPATAPAGRAPAVATGADSPATQAAHGRPDAPRPVLEAAADRLLADVIGRARSFGGRTGPGLETTLRVADLGVLRLVLEGPPGEVRASLVARDDRVAEAIARAVERAGRSVDAPAGLVINVRAETASAGRDGAPWATSLADGDGQTWSRGARPDPRDPGPGAGGRPAVRRPGGLDVLA